MFHRCQVMLCIKDMNTEQCWLPIYRLRHEIPVEVTQQLYIAIETIMTINPDTIILGDLNYRGIDWLCKDGPVALDGISYEFLELCASCNLTQVVTEPTRLDRCSDLILTPRSELFLFVVVQPPVLMKDYSLVECKWNSFKKPTVIGVSRRDFGHADYGMMSQILSATNWSVVFADCSTVNQNWDSLYEILQLLVHDCANN